ncbi:MAG: galactose mutarotase [Bacteroidota bacterium]|nr:galactose mutarotase [Bacteroidota bacterium]
MNHLLTETNYWGTIDNQEICLYHLRNANNVQISITNFGATITEINVPDKSGNFADIALGYDDLQGYINDPYYMGGIVGRFANRIAGGWVALDGKAYRLTVKPGGYHHHGGAIGFNKKVWNAEAIVNNGFPAVKMQYLSVDGEEGFPGNLLATVTYTLNDQNQLIVDFSATTDKTTLINLTQHSYFNLAGQGSGNILDHKLMMPLTAYLPVNESQVPNGEIAPVANTPFDFTEAKTIGERIDADNEQLILSAGYDHSWVIKAEDSDQLKLAALASDEKSGRTLSVYTTEPAVHVYTGNFLGDAAGKAGYIYPKRSGFCLETQHYPDAPNRANFPSTVLKAGDTFKSTTIFEFGVRNN